MVRSAFFSISIPFCHYKPPFGRLKYPVGYRPLFSRETSLWSPRVLPNGHRTECVWSWILKRTQSFSSYADGDHWQGFGEVKLANSPVLSLKAKFLLNITLIQQKKATLFSCESQYSRQPHSKILTFIQQLTFN